MKLKLSLHISNSQKYNILKTAKIEFIERIDEVVSSIVIFTEEYFLFSFIRFYFNASA